MKTLSISLAAILTFSLSADEDRTIDVEYKIIAEFRTPVEFFSDHNFSPLQYFSHLEKSDIGKDLISQPRLTASQKSNLKELFINASKACRLKYKQTYFVNKSSPLCKLLIKEFPAVDKIPAEPGGEIRLDDIEKSLSAIK